MQIRVRCYAPRGLSFVLPILLLLAANQTGTGQESRFFEQGGVTFKETRTKVQQPVREIEYQDQQQTFYRERYVTDIQTTPQTVYQPTTQYVWEPRWHEWWRPFQGPHLAYHLVPHAAWQPQVVNQQIPVTRREVIPETRTVRVPTQKLSMKEVEQVSRVAVGPAASNMTLAQAPSTSSPSLAWNLPTVPNSVPYPATVYVPPVANYAYVPTYGTSNYSYPYGGVAQLESDPPRYGSGLAALPAEVHGKPAIVPTSKRGKAGAELSVRGVGSESRRDFRACSPRQNSELNAKHRNSLRVSQRARTSSCGNRSPGPEPRFFSDDGVFGDERSEQSTLW